MLTVDNNVSFGAKLDLSKLKGKKRYWGNVSDEFQKITDKRRSNYVLKLKRDKDMYNGIEIDGISPVNNELVTIASIQEDFVSKLESLSPKKTAKKLKVMYDISGYKEKFFMACKDFWHKHMSVESIDDGIDDALSEDFFKVTDKVENMKIKNWLKKDSDLTDPKNVRLLW